MGPITLFDKSFLQSLNIDESVWFDHFFRTNICPLFYIETLTDLEKSVRKGRTPEQEVGIIADKFPEMHSSPNVHHVTACTGELLGHPVPMTGQILLAGGRPVMAGGKSGIVFEESPEAEAFSRWQNGKFLEIERLQAHRWREMLTNLDLKEVAQYFRKLGIDSKTCKTLEQAKSIAMKIVSNTDKPFDTMYLALLFLNVDSQHHQEILHRWSIENYPSLTRYAPYTAYVYTVELFFQIALAANLISSERPSNRVDISYLFYLPFSMIFVSTDKLHQKCAPLFLQKNQQFIWGLDLKSELNNINDHYISRYSEEQKEKGVMSFAGQPPKEGDFLIAKIWDKHFTSWRKEKEIDISDKNIKNDELVAYINQFADAATILHEGTEFDAPNSENLLVKRMVRKQKGVWFQIPKNLTESK